MQVFNSRDIRYRKPFGAVTQGTTVLFRICIPRSWSCRAAWLIHESDGGLARWDGMFWAGMEDDDHEWWDCRYTVNEVNLYWYSFAVDTVNGRQFLSCRPDGTACCGDTLGNKWQLTCYDKTFTTPDWLAGGVFYQIFPDRFCCSGKPKLSVPSDRILHERWGEPPEWRPDALGVVNNNDFFGGDLDGIRQKLPYLKKLGVTCLYLNPIFESHSNHRYDTADYTNIDPLLGTQENLFELIKEAKKMGIRIMLDGVFSHTGADSRYFNKKRRYSEQGAYQSKESPYAAWYHFAKWPNEYTGWWGFDTLPEVNECAPSFITYIMQNVIRHWLNVGIAGWRLDVADELPDAFLEELRRTVKTADSDAFVLGEVWEDASNKQSYGHRRRYLLGYQLDSVMNYPFRSAVLDFLREGNGVRFINSIYTVVENYPPPVTRLLMNSLGTHDTERALTALAGEPANGRGRRWQSETKLSPDQRALGIRRLKAAAVLQYCLPGVPCLYYGDEAGVEGYRDPFNRTCYPWGQEDNELINLFCALGKLRATVDAFREGSFVPIQASEEFVVFDRCGKENAIRCAVNRSDAEQQVRLEEGWRIAFGSGTIYQDYLCLPPISGIILVKD